jgi:hypothetical protein
MTGDTISKIAQQIAQKTGGNAVQLEKQIEKKILNAINAVSDSKKYTINEIETMLTSPQAKNQLLCLKKNIEKGSRIMSGGNGADELVTLCCWGIVGIVSLVIFLSNASDEEAFLLGAIMASGGGRKRKTRKRRRKTRRKRKKSKHKRN